MPIELKDLRWAIIATQHRSLRQAAERLNIRQSTLSRRLRSMEAMLGVQLFERTNGGTRPTIEGLEFLEAAAQIIGGPESITARLKTRSRGESGRLTIGVHASLSAGNLTWPNSARAPAAGVLPVGLCAGGCAEICETTPSKGKFCGNGHSAAQHVRSRPILVRGPELS